MFYEIIYEDGSHSVASYDSDEEAKTAVQAANERAVNGQTINSSHPGIATRVKRVLVYSEHPNEYNPQVTADDLKIMLEETGDLMVLASRIQSLASPQAEKEAPHDSFFQMQEERELAWNS